MMKFHTQNEENSGLKRTVSMKKVADSNDIVKKFGRRTSIRIFKQKSVKMLGFDNKFYVFETNNKYIRYIDIIVLLINISTLIALYFDHFEYIDSDFNLSTNSYIIRSVFLFLSLVICFLMIVRYKIKNKNHSIQVQLGTKKPIQHRKNRKKLILFVEILLHLLQPYPGVRYEFHITTIGKNLTYNINMLFYFLCSFRIYILIKIIRYYNLFLQHQSKNILKFYDKLSNTNTFLYRANLKRSGFITIALLGGLTLIYSSLIFQIVEYNKKDETNPYFYLLNCCWYIIVTMCTIGYGDMTPITLLGRLVAIISCLIGIFIISIFVVTLSLYVNLDEDERMAYNEIVALGDTTAKKQKIENYMTQYILCKYRFIRKKIELDTVLKRRKVDFEKKNIFIDLKKKYTKKYNIQEFNKNTMKNLDDRRQAFYDKLDNLIYMQERSEDLIDYQDEMLENCRSSQKITFALVNFVKCIGKEDGVGKITDLSSVENKKIIRDKQYSKARTSNVNPGHMAFMKDYSNTLHMDLISQKMF